jgi:hypothetical protein
MGGMVDGQRVSPARVKIVSGLASAAREQTPREDATPPGDLGEPGALCGRHMDHLLGRRSAQARPPRGASAAGLGNARPAAPLGDEVADVEAPVGMEVIPPPGVARPLGPLGDPRGPRGGPSGAGARLAQMPDAVRRGDAHRGEAGPPPLPAVLGRAFCWRARLDGRGRRATWAPRPPGGVRSAEDEASCGVQAQSLARAWTTSLRRALTGGSVAVAPVPTPRRREGGLRQEAPEAGAPAGLQPLRRAGGAHVVQTPPGGGTMRRGRLPGRPGAPIHARRGGPRAAGALRVGQPAGRGSRASESADATGRPEGAPRPSRWPRAEGRGALARRSGGSADRARRKLGGGNGRAQVMPHGRVPPEHG